MTALKKILHPAVLVLIALLGCLCAGDLYFLSQTRALTRENRSLLQKAEALDRSIQNFKEQNKSLLDTLEREKLNAKNAVESLQRQNESLKMDIKKIDLQLKSALEDKRTMEEMLVKYKNGGERSASASEPAITGQADLIRKLQDKEAEVVALKEQNQTLTKKLESLTQTMNEKITQINIAKIALAETVEDASKKLSDEINTVSLGSLDMRQTSPAQTPPQARSAKKEGRVLKVNDEQGFVVVDLGRVDNIKTDTKMIVRRDGTDIATLSVIQVRDVMSACNIKQLEPNQKIQENDLVFTQR